MWFGLLGLLTVVEETGEPVEIAGLRLRGLLAALLLEANSPVSGEVLAEAVWNGAPSPGAHRTLHSHIARLRRALGVQGAGRIEAREPGYLVHVASTELDVLEFEALCQMSGEALRCGAWEQASDAAARALGLWRGEPLLDVASQVLRDRFVPRLEQLRLQALEDRAEAELHLGRHERLVPQLRELTGAHPLRERFHTQLMQALAGAGRRAEALQAYRDARRVLVEELGIEPGPGLRDLHGRILAGNDAQPTAKPSTDQAPTPVAAVGAVPRQLPAAPGHFTGRHGELEWLTGLADRSDPAAGVGGTVVISAIDGMAGIGKTALAVHAAYRLANRFPGGQLFVDLHGYTKGYPPRKPGEALEAFLRTLGMPPGQIPEETEQRAALYRQRLADTSTLIVLDNALDEAQVRPLLPGAPGCLVLVTSRRRLKGLDDARSLPLDLLAPQDAVALLRAVAGPSRVPADDPAVGEIAELCGYLPLALRIAGALLRHRPAWGLGHLAGQLRDQHQRVQALSDGERDLGAVFDLSYTGLGERHRRLFRSLGLVPGADADAYAAAALLDTDPAAATGLLEDLVDHNLLIAHAPGRYRLHDLIRAHARTLADHDPQPDRDAAVNRLLHYYAHTAQSASIPIARYPRPAPGGPAHAPAHAPVLPRPEAARAWLRAERDNLEAARNHARTLALDEHTLALAAGLAEILRTDGPLTRALDLHQAAAETAERQGRPAAHATALTDLGTARRLTGDLPGATDALSQALEIHRETGDRQGEAYALNELGRVQEQTGDLPGASDAHTRALEIYRETGHRQGEAGALTDLGSVRRLAGDLPEAAETLTRALEIYRETGDRQGEATALNELGRVRRPTGDLPGAAEFHARALEIFRAIGHRLGEAAALNELGRVRRLAGDLPGAAETHARAMEIYRETGHRGNEAWALNHYAATVAATGDLTRALALYRQALAINRELGNPVDEAIALEGLGECHLSDGDTETAATHLHQALEIFQRLGMAADTIRVQDRLDGTAAGVTAE